MKEEEVPKFKVLGIDHYEITPEDYFGMEHLYIITLSHSDWVMMSTWMSEHLKEYPSRTPLTPDEMGKCVITPVTPIAKKVCDTYLQIHTILQAVSCVRFKPMLGLAA